MPKLPFIILVFAHSSCLEDLLSTIIFKPLKSLSALVNKSLNMAHIALDLPEFLSRRFFNQDDRQKIRLLQLMMVPVNCKFFSLSIIVICDRALNVGESLIIRFIAVMLNCESVGLASSQAMRQREIRIVYLRLMLSPFGRLFYLKVRDLGKFLLQTVIF